MRAGGAGAPFRSCSTPVPPFSPRGRAGGWQPVPVTGTQLYTPGAALSMRRSPELRCALFARAAAADARAQAHRLVHQARQLRDDHQALHAQAVAQAARAGTLTGPSRLSHNLVLIADHLVTWHDPLAVQQERPTVVVPAVYARQDRGARPDLQGRRFAAVGVAGAD